MSKEQREVKSLKDQRIQLDVGGSLFSTTFYTLTKFPESQLAILVKSNESSIIKEGKLFIDRDGTHFRYILNYLRDNEVEIPNDNSMIKKELIKEASYYGLTGLMKLIEKQYDIVPRTPETESNSASRVAFTQNPLQDSNHTVLSGVQEQIQSQSATCLVSEVSNGALPEVASDETNNLTRNGSESVEDLLNRNKNDIEQLMKMLNYIRQLREVLNLEIRDYRQVLEQQKKFLSDTGNPELVNANMEKEIVELRLEVDNLKRKERKAISQKVKLCEEIKNMEEEIEILKSVLEKEKAKMKDEIMEQQELLEQEKKNAERHRRHLELEIKDLKEQIEERDQVIEKQKKYFELEVKELKERLASVTKR